jgi:hypothetical protein
VNIYRKLQVANRTEAAHWALDHGLTPAGSLWQDRDPQQA